MTQPAPTHPRWASKKKVAAHVDVNPETVDEWVKDGRITAYRCGPRLIRYNLNEVDAMLTPKMTQEGVR